MPKALVIRPRAGADVRDQARYLAEAASREVATRFLDAFEAALERLQRFPRQGQPWPTDHPELQGIRQLVMTTFSVSIFYRDTEAHIEIVRMLHGRRDLPSLLED